MKVRVISDWLNSCSGCEVAIVDFGLRLLTVLEHVDFLHIPVLLDHKYYGQLGDRAYIELPEADVGIISGGIRNEEHLEVAEKMREKCKIIIALGTCATHGGIPALVNSYKNEDVLKRYYSTETTDIPERYPYEGVPPLLDRCYALDEKIKVDVYIPGCAPHPDGIFEAITSLLNGETPILSDKSVCDTCPRVRKGKGDVKRIKRFVYSMDITEINKPLDERRCFLEQGFLCFGPVTKGGCGGEKRVPRCISANVPCRGCYGPVKMDGNQMLDLLSALVSNGVELDTIPEYTSLNRFCGAHGNLRPKLNL